MTLRTKTTFYFCAGFICICTLISLLLFTRFRSTLRTAFDDELRSKAALVAGKTSLQPRVVPLPESTDLFLILYRTGNRTDTLYRPQPVPFTIPGNDSVFTSNNRRIVRWQQTAENGGTLEVIYAAQNDEVQNQVRQTAIYLWIILLAGAILSGAIAWYFSSKLLQPIQQVIRQANTINIYRHVAPLPLPVTETEGRELVLSINRMLARIQEQAERQTAFFAAASHELRTPLSVMQTRLQVLLQTVRQNAVLKEAYSSQLEEVQKLSKMVNDFLLMSRLQAGSYEVKKGTVDLIASVTQLVETRAAKALLRQNHFRIKFLPAEGDFEVLIDAEKTEIILGNLLDNAVKYARENTVIQIMVENTLQQVSIRIENTIRADVHPEPVDIKNAFYHSKPLHGEGFGLGLWIANQLAVLQNMDLYCAISKEQTFMATLVIGE